MAFFLFFEPNYIYLLYSKLNFFQVALPDIKYWLPEKKTLCAILHDKFNRNANYRNQI